MDTCSNLYDLLRQQADGKPAAADAIREVVRRICGTHVYRDHDLTAQQVRGLELLLLEWSGMFSFFPGRPEGLAPLMKLVQQVGRTPQFEATDIYARPEWKQIINLRGPVETVQIVDCESCRTKYPRMGMSGFLDLLDLLCARCGGIVFRSAYSQSREATCSCGGTAKPGCPACGALKGRVVKAMSPYQYSRTIGSFATMQASPAPKRTGCESAFAITIDVPNRFNDREHIAHAYATWDRDHLCSGHAQDRRLL
jgi:hypothetical protein